MIEDWVKWNVSADVEQMLDSGFSLLLTMKDQDLYSFPIVTTPIQLKGILRSLDRKMTNLNIFFNIQLIYRCLQENEPFLRRRRTLEYDGGGKRRRVL